jgi:ribose transport system ATP-binding protein
MSAVRLKMKNVAKRFGATAALRSVDLEVTAGEIHALIGENGAGKSTLMKVLSGAHKPDSGRIELDGEPFKPANPLQARRHGIVMIYQELNLAPHLTVEENIFLGGEPHWLGWIRRSQRRELARNALAELHHPGIPLNAPVHHCSLAEKQVVEIARALIGSPRVLIMDEPTSSLAQADTETLFAVLHRLRARGVSIIYISHFLEECQRLADRYTVLRDGQTVGTGHMKEARIPHIIRWMVGREIQEIYPRTPHLIGQPVLEVKQLRGTQKPRAATFTLRQGEIFGVAGLIGAGRTETLRACFGLDPLAAGEIKLDGKESTHGSPAKRLRQGIGFLSENRKEEGLMLTRTLADNLTLSWLKPLTFSGFVRGRKQRVETYSWMEKLSVRAQGPLQTAGELSGGNQQKVALGRLLHQQARILLLDEPTRGIDVASKVQIYQLICELAAQGRAIIFVSSYLPELLGVCDTIGVMCRGVLAEARPAAEWDEHSIMLAATGQANCEPIKPLLK